MAEYVDREAYENEFQTYCPLDEVGGVINDIPAADVVEVVRCKGCIYYEKGNDYKPPYCNNIDGLNEPDVDDFCSYGVRQGGCNNCNNHSNERKGGKGE